MLNRIHTSFIAPTNKYWGASEARSVLQNPAVNGSASLRPSGISVAVFCQNDTESRPSGLNPKGVAAHTIPFKPGRVFLGLGARQSMRARICVCTCTRMSVCLVRARGYVGRRGKAERQPTLAVTTQGGITG